VGAAQAISSSDVLAPASSLRALNVQGMAPEHEASVRAAHRDVAVWLERLLDGLSPWVKDPTFEVKYVNRMVIVRCTPKPL